MTGDRNRSASGLSGSWLCGILALCLIAAHGSSQCVDIVMLNSDGPNPNPSVQGAACTICNGTVYWVVPGTTWLTTRSVLPPYDVTCYSGTCSLTGGTCICITPQNAVPYQTTSSLIEGVHECPESEPGGPES